MKIDSIRHYENTCVALCDDECGGHENGVSFIFDEVENTVRFGGRTARLTNKEFRLVKCLAEQLDRLVSIDEIIRAVWCTDQWITSNTVAVHVSKVRKKLRLNPEFGVLLRSEYGRGYQLLCTRKMAA
jgi:DNA-binding response OmpR family regulator